MRRQSIVVVPFEAIGEYLHHRAFTFKDMDLSAREIGVKLEVDYVLEGSIRRVDDAFRINPQLVDAAIWVSK